LALCYTNTRIQALNDPETKNKEDLAKRQQEFEADQFINERNDFITALEANHEKGKEILKDDKYAYARAVQEYDKKKLQKAEHAGWGNLTLGILQRSAAKLVGSVGELMNIGENLIKEDKKYTAWDKVEDFLIDFQDQTAKVAPRPTKYTRPLYTKTAKTTLNGEKVEVDYVDDKPSVVRNSQGMVIEADMDQLKDLKPKNQYNSKGLIYQTGEVLADAIVQIATTKGIGGSLVKTGMSAKVAYATGVTASTMGQMAGGLYDQGLKMFDGDKKKAAQYATMTGLAIGASSNLFGLEARLAGGPSLFNMTAAQAAKGLTPKVAAARTAVAWTKGAAGEMTEETIIEKGIEGATAMVLGGDAEDIDLNEMKGTALISFATGLIMTGGSNDFTNSAWLVAAENPEEFKKALQAEVANGKKVDVEKMYQKALKIKGLSEIKEVREEDIPKLDELTDLKDKAEKAKAIGADAQAKVFKEQAEAKEVEIFKESEAEEIPDEALTEEIPSETPAVKPSDDLVGRQFTYNGYTGELKKEGERYVIENDRQIIELDEEAVIEEVAKPEVSDQPLSKQYEISSIDDESATINGVDYNVITDEKGNISGLSPKDKPDQVIKNERMLVAAEIQRNKQEAVKFRDVPDEQYTTLKAEHEDGEAIEMALASGMNETISNAIDALYDEKQLDDDSALELAYWIDDRVAALEELGTPSALNAVRNLNTIKERIYESSSQNARANVPKKRVKKVKAPKAAAVKPAAAKPEKTAEDQGFEAMQKAFEFDAERRGLTNSSESVSPKIEEQAPLIKEEPNESKKAAKKQSAKQTFESSIDQSIADLDITQEQADALKQTTSANAQNWAKRTGKTEEEFYEKFKPTVSRNTTQIPDDALKQIVGEKADVPTARKNLQIAKRAEGKMTPKAIYLATGWEKVDGKWKYDLPDVKVGRLEGTQKLGDVATGGILDAYPDAKDIEITVDPELKSLGVRQGNKITLRSDDKTVLIHELQHWVQQKEGFARGASPEAISEGNLSRIKEARDKFLAQNPNIKKALSDPNTELSEAEVEKLVENKKLLTESAEVLGEIFKKYEAVAGEVEARNAAKRSEMSPAERKLTPISETEDTKDKIFLQQQEGQTLGAFSTIDGEASAWLFDGATVETLFHEIDPTTGHFGHAVMYDILDNALPEHKAQAEADVKTIEEFLGASDRNWTREQHEQFVAAGEKYLREGVAPTPELRPVFERLKTWLTDIFNSIKDRVDIDITPEVRQVFARMMGREEMLPLIEEVNRAVDQPGFSSGFIGEKIWGVAMKSNAMSWLKKAWKYTFFGRGDLPLDVAQLNYRRIARIEGMMKQAELTANKLKKLIKGKTPQQVEDLNYALQSTATTYSDGRQIEPEILDLIGKMREHVTSMSSELINTGIADGKLAAIISKNLDTYLTRSYQIHFNKNWVKTVKDTAAYTRAKAFLDKKFAQEEADAQAKIAKYQAKLPNNPEYWGKRIKNQQKRIGRDVEAELDAILEKQAKGLSLGDVAKSGSLGSMNLGVFKKRKEIAEEIRDVFGEVKDPIVNYMTSIFKTAHILENNKFLSKVEDEGRDKFLFERPTGPYTAQFPSTPQMGPLAELYSTPEIVEAFRLYNKPIGDMTEEGDVMGLVYKSILGITSRAKSFMTIFSIASTSRNLVSNLLLQAQKGLFNVADPNIGKAIAVLRGKNESELVEMYSLGVLGDGITFGEIADVRKQYARKFAGIDKTEAGKLKSAWGAVEKFMSTLYQFGDEFYRAIDYYRNLDKMARLYKGDEYKNLSPDVRQEVKQLAADRVSSENPTYSRLPRNIKALRRNPFVAPFPSFPYEMVRVSYNIMANLIQDMKMGQDTKVKVAGVDMSYKNLMLGKVMAGSMAVSIAPFLLKELITNMLGWADDDDEKLKYFVPFYHEGSLLIPSPWNDQKGSVDYYDWGYMFPQGHLLSTVSTVSDERFSPAENVGRAAEKFFEPFYSIDPLMKSLVEATYGQQLGKTGRPISQVGETGWLKARMEHVGKKLTPGTIKSFERVFRSFNEPETDYYGKLNPIQEGVAIFPGFRSYNVDIHRSFGFLGRSMADKINDSKADYGVEKNKEQIKALPEKEREAHLGKVKEREMKDYGKFVMDFHEIYMAAIEFPGVDKGKIDESLKDLRLDAITIRGIMTGEVGEPEFFKKK